jgi:hypothetical protein
MLSSSRLEDGHPRPDGLRGWRVRAGALAGRQQLLRRLSCTLPASDDGSGQR